MTPSKGARYSALLADDVSALRKLLRLAIESSGRFEVVAEAGNGREALEHAGRSRPD